MSSFLPIPNYSTDPAETSLRATLSRVDSWVLSFLFPTTAHHEQLQQTLLQPRSVTADMSITTLSPSTDALSLNESVRFLLLPSFSTGPVNVAYQVTEYLNTNISAYQSPYIARCVRDDNNAFLLSVADLPDTGLTELSCCSQQSPGFREHVFMVLATAPFREAMRKLATGAAYDAALMKQALIYTFRGAEIRECPSCGRRSLACTCPLQIVQKRHPLDFDSDIVNLRSYMGSYDGVCYQALYQDGVNMYNGTYPTRASVQFSYDTDGRRRLESWALQDTLKGRSINLFKLNMPEFDVLQQPAIESIESIGDIVDPIDPVDEVLGKSVLATSPFSDSVDLPTDLQMNRFMSDGDVQAIPPGLLDLENIDDAQDQSVVQSDAATTCIMHDTQHEQSAQFSDSAVSSRSHQPTPDKDDKPTPTCDESGPQEAQPLHEVNASIPTSPPIQQPVPQGNIQPLTIVNDGIMRPKRMGRPPAPKPRVRTRVVPIVPATSAWAGVQKAFNPTSDEAIQRIESRKARNRASAVRSNEKKKKQVQELKQNLNEAKEREAALRQEERELREANLELRARLAE